MKKIITLMLVLIFALTACAPDADEPVSSEPVYINTSIPTEQNLYLPQTADQSLTRSPAFVDFKEILTLESFPPQFTLHLTGSLPTPCNQLRVAVSAPDSENKVLVDVYSVSDPDKMCMQVIEPFDINIPLGSFPEGKYTLWVNGEMVAEFQA
jgi:hypothetical protein